jgi:peroxiredoxin
LSQPNERLREESMVSTTTPPASPHAAAAAFDLPGVDGKRHTLASARGPNGIVVMFICNHCPYVKAVIDKIVRDMGELRQHGIGAIAVMSNDTAAYPDDSFDNMKAFAARHAMTFPYVQDETQDVARAYGAVCTPDFFGFDRDLKLAYRGRLDASGRSSDPAAARELFDAMCEVARTGRTSAAQHASVGCSIKWRHA